MDDNHSPFVYRCFVCTHRGIRRFSIDCEEHEYSDHTTLFSDAIGRAMLHRQAAIR